MSLCYKCREFYEKKFGLGYWVSPSNHCHCTEPEEKQVCWWCEDWERFEKIWEQSTTIKVVKKLIGLNPDNPECPICGRKLKEAI